MQPCAKSFEALVAALQDQNMREALRLADLLQSALPEPRPAAFTVLYQEAQLLASESVWRSQKDGNDPGGWRKAAAYLRRLEEWLAAQSPGLRQALCDHYNWRDLAMTAQMLEERANSREQSQGIIRVFEEKLRTNWDGFLEDLLLELRGDPANPQIIEWVARLIEDRTLDAQQVMEVVRLCLYWGAPEPGLAGRMEKRFNLALNSQTWHFVMLSLSQLEKEQGHDALLKACKAYALLPEKKDLKDPQLQMVWKKLAERTEQAIQAKQSHKAGPLVDCLALLDAPVNLITRLNQQLDEIRVKAKTARQEEFRSWVETQTREFNTFRGKNPDRQPAWHKMLKDILKDGGISFPDLAQNVEFIDWQRKLQGQIETLAARLGQIAQYADEDRENLRAAMALLEKNFKLPEKGTPPLTELEFQGNLERARDLFRTVPPQRGRSLVDDEREVPLYTRVQQLLEDEEQVKSGPKFRYGLRALAAVSASSARLQNLWRIAGQKLGHSSICLGYLSADEYGPMEENAPKDLDRLYAELNRGLFTLRMLFGAAGARRLHIYRDGERAARVSGKYRLAAHQKVAVATQVWVASVSDRLRTAPEKSAGRPVPSTGKRFPGWVYWAGGLSGLSLLCVFGLFVFYLLIPANPITRFWQNLWAGGPVVTATVTPTKTNKNLIGTKAPTATLAATPEASLPTETSVPTSEGSLPTETSVPTPEANPPTETPMPTPEGSSATISTPEGPTALTLSQGEGKVTSMVIFQNKLYPLMPLQAAIPADAQSNWKFAPGAKPGDLKLVFIPNEAYQWTVRLRIYARWADKDDKGIESNVRYDGGTDRLGAFAENCVTECNWVPAANPLTKEETTGGVALEKYEARLILVKDGEQQETELAPLALEPVGYLYATGTTYCYTSCVKYDTWEDVFKGAGVDAGNDKTIDLLGYVKAEDGLYYVLFRLNNETSLHWTKSTVVNDQHNVNEVDFTTVLKDEKRRPAMLYAISFVKQTE